MLWVLQILCWRVEWNSTIQIINTLLMHRANVWESQWWCLILFIIEEIVMLDRGFFVCFFFHGLGFCGGGLAQRVRKRKGGCSVEQLECTSIYWQLHSSWIICEHWNAWSNISRNRENVNSIPLSLLNLLFSKKVGSEFNTLLFLANVPSLSWIMCLYYSEVLVDVNMLCSHTK